MKSINDDIEYQKSMSLINELTGKRDDVLKQINKIQEFRLSSNTGEPPADAVETALQIEPGVEGSPRPDLNDRYQTLVNQEQVLHRAITIHYVKHDQIRRAAGYRVFAHQSDKYEKLSEQLLATVDRLIALNQQLVNEQRSLHDAGATDMPEVRFPAFGLNEQLPAWREALEERIQSLKHTKRVHTNVN